MAKNATSKKEGNKKSKIDLSQFHSASELGTTLKGEQLNSKDDILNTPIVVEDVLELESGYEKKRRTSDTDTKNTYCIFQFFELADQNVPDNERDRFTTTGGEVLVQKLMLAKAEGKLPAVGKLIKVPTKNKQFAYYDFVELDEEDLKKLEE